MSDESATGLTVERADATVAMVDSQLQQAKRYYPRNLPPHHYARLTGWRPRGDAFPGLDDWNGLPAGSPPARGSRRPKGRPRRAPASGTQSNLAFVGANPDLPVTPLPRRLEVCRSHAEAMLVHHGLEQVGLDVATREGLTARALGVLPDTEAARFGELLSCPEFHPERAGRSAAGLLALVESIESGMGPATALAYGMLVVAGVRSPGQLAEHAAGIDRLFGLVIADPEIIRGIDRVAAEADEQSGPILSSFELAGSRSSETRFQLLFDVLLGVRDRLWQLKPDRASTPFLLTQVLENYLSDRGSVGNSLGLGVLDAVVVGKLGLPVRFHIEHEVIALEVLVAGKSIYWDTTRPTPPGFVPASGSRPMTTAELFAVAYGSLATAHFNAGRLEAAVKAYRHVLELAPDSAPTHNSIAACRLRQRLPDQALVATEEALRARPDMPEVHYTQGNAWAMMEEWPRAIAAFKRAIALRPDYVEVYNNLGFAFQRAGNPSQAVAAFRAAIEIRPDYSQAHFNLGNIHLELEQFDEAVECYREAARLSPAMAQAWYNLGQALYRKGDVDGAITAYRRAVEVNPKHFGAWHNLGIAYRDKGMTDKAVEALERAVAINPNLMR